MRATARSRPPSCTLTLRRTAPFTPASPRDVTWNLRKFASGLVGRLVQVFPRAAHDGKEGDLDVSPVLLVCILPMGKEKENNVGC